MHNVIEVFGNVNGNSFVGLDTETIVDLAGGKANPMKGRVTKRTLGSQIMVFQNKNTNGYDAMVRRRLEAEGKNPDDFQLSPRKWGERLPDCPFIKHIKADTVDPEYYIEAIFLRGGESSYFLDGNPIDKANIIGLKEPKASVDAQAGLENQVIVRSYKVSSLIGVRIDKTEYTGTFYYG
jgi:hypothetical protein